MLVIIGAVGLLILVALIFGGGELPDAIAFILALAAIIFMFLKPIPREDVF